LTQSHKTLAYCVALPGALFGKMVSEDSIKPELLTKMENFRKLSRIESNSAA
jgi:hypothetical protein